MRLNESPAIICNDLPMAISPEHDWPSIITADGTASWHVWADWLEEAGQQERAKWVRIAAERNVLPLSRKDQWTWYFGAGGNGLNALAPNEDIAYQWFSREKLHFRYFKTPHDALLALADACIDAEK